MYTDKDNHESERDGLSFILLAYHAGLHMFWCGRKPSICSAYEVTGKKKGRYSGR